ncbi:hypothetical protein [Enterovibrio norvegicus]|uniref:hypothetical protein n=1 Tax=Enterovibrio norvegicus TaxID=188144 RepID=UPI00352E8D8B
MNKSILILVALCLIIFIPLFFLSGQSEKENNVSVQIDESKTLLAPKEISPRFKPSFTKVVQGDSVEFPNPNKYDPITAEVALALAESLNQLQFDGYDEYANKYGHNLNNIVAFFTSERYAAIYAEQGIPAHIIDVLMTFREAYLAEMAQQNTWLSDVEHQTPPHLLLLSEFSKKISKYITYNDPELSIYEAINEIESEYGNDILSAIEIYGQAFLISEFRQQAFPHHLYYGGFDQKSEVEIERENSIKPQKEAIIKHLIEKGYSPRSPKLKGEFSEEENRKILQSISQMLSRMKS